MTDDDLRWLRGPDLHVAVAVAPSPRVAVLARPGGRNLLAQLDGVEASAGPGHPVVVLRGGHRLWVAPETPELTYVPDEGPAAEEEISDVRISVSWSAPPLRKSLAVSLEEGGVRISHELEHRGDHPVRAASWGLTQLPLGGRAVLPVGRAPRDATGLQSSGAIVVWPYSDLDDPRLSLHRDAVVIAARPRDDDPGTGTPRPRTPEAHRLKVGTDGRPGWIAYVRDDELLVIRHEREAGAAYAELGAVAQAYVDHRFLELETAGPLVELAPGARTGHDVRMAVLRLGSEHGAEIDVEAVRDRATAVPGVG